MDTVKAKKRLTKPIKEIFAERLRRGSFIRIIIRGNSMRPFIREGDIVTVKPIEFQEARIGDIIAYTRPAEDAFTAHRVIRKRRDKEGRQFLFTKGDACICGDFPVYSTDVYGKVVSIKRRGGKVIDLETRFNRFLACPIAYLSWALAALREAIFYPSLFLKRLRKYFFGKG